MNLQSQITVTLRAEGPGPELPIRLRRFLKWSLRQAGLRCVQIGEVQDPTLPVAARGMANLGAPSPRPTFDPSSVSKTGRQTAQGEIGRDEPHD